MVALTYALEHRPLDAEADAIWVVSDPHHREGEFHADGQLHGYAFGRSRVGHPMLSSTYAWAAGDAPDDRPTMSTASARRLTVGRQGVRASGKSANARGPVSDLSAGLSDPVPHDAGVMALVSVVGLLCPVSVWVVPDQCRVEAGVRYFAGHGGRSVTVD